MNQKKMMKFLIIAAVIIIPVMYSFFYLKAFWDPYGSLHEMKVAIVNLDEGEKEENLGKELVTKLQEKDTMTFVSLQDRDQAQKGLIDEEYYATITIPKDFTQTLNKAENKERQMATITYSPNQKSNYLASQIVNKVTTTVEMELRGEVSQKVVAKLSDKLQEVPDKMEEIAEGAGQIKEGTDQLNTGLSTLQKGTNELSTNYEKFHNGVGSAYAGSTDLKNGVTQLNTGINQVATGSKQLAEGTKDLNQVTEGVKQLTSSTNQLASGVSQYVEGVNQAVTGVTTTQKQVTILAKDIQSYVTTHPEVMAQSEFQKIMKDLQSISSNGEISSQLSILKAKGNELQTGAQTLNKAVQSFASQAGKLKELQTGVQSLNAGIVQLKQGIAQIQTGSSSLNNGLEELNTNSEKIQTGIQSLEQGSQTALAGSQTLQTGAGTFQAEIDHGIVDTKEQLNDLEGLDEYVKEPVKVEEKDYAAVDSYGVGFAPYFMSISLWVGALIALVMFYGDAEDRFKSLGKNTKNKWIRTGLYVVVATAQGMVLGFLLKLGLGFEVTNLGLYYGTCILIAMVFMSIIQFFMINFGDVGKFLAILLLVLQLAASGGTFPIETVPRFFQAIYPFMPMNYTIRLIKESMIVSDSSMILQNVGILVSIWIIFTGLTITIDWIRNKKTTIK